MGMEGWRGTREGRWNPSSNSGLCCQADRGLRMNDIHRKPSGRQLRALGRDEQGGAETVAESLRTEQERRCAEGS